MNISPTFDPTLTKPIKFEAAAAGQCNTSDEVIMAQVAANIRRGLPQVQQFAPSGQTALLVCGGPSLKETERDLIEAYWAGGKIVAANGAYAWCVARNLKPSAMIMLDAREFNARFVEPVVPGCRYLLASQCHPAAFEACRDREVWIWHACSGGESELALLREFYFDRCHPITIGTTVGVRAISVLRMLGWSRIDVFGLDSCWLNGAHHAYEQAENNDLMRTVWLRPEGRDDLAQMFTCAPWHVKQAQDFMLLVKERGSILDLNVRGSGLIASMLRTGANISTEETRNGIQQGED